MQKITLNGQNVEKLMKLIGGTIIVINGDTLWVAGADLTKMPC